MLLPYSFTALRSEAYRSDVEELFAVCAERGVAVQTIKAVARRRWPADATEPRHSWYEPLPDGDALARAVRWVLARPQLFLNTSSDVRLLPSILAAAEAAGDAPSDEEMAADVSSIGIEPLFDGSTLERI